MKRIKQNATIVVSLGGLKGGKGENNEEAVAALVVFCTILNDESDPFEIAEDMTFEAMRQLYEAKYPPDGDTYLYTIAGDLIEPDR
jgi:hypothetical protein